MNLIPKEAITDLFENYISEDLFQIAQGTNKSLILIVPYSKIEIIKKSQVIRNLQNDFFELVIQYTEEKISGPESIKIIIESKEDFATKYESSWFNYFR